MALRIILVDDEPPLLTLLSRMLVRAGYEVTAFASAEETLAATGVDSASPHLLITDQQLPGKTGAELAVELGSVWPALRSIVCSGLPVELNDLPAEMRRRVRSLPKPFSPDQLLETVTAALSDAAPVD